VRRIAAKLFPLQLLQVLFARRLRHLRNDRLRDRLNEIAPAFLEGYRAALEEREPAAVAARLAGVEPERQGFAAEGIGMGLGLLDSVTPGRRDRLQRFLSGPGAHQAYSLHAGAGWAIACPLVSPRSLLTRLDPVLRGLALDGYGFFRAFFFWRSTVTRQRRPAWISGAALPSFDAGVGRRLWFFDSPDLTPVLRLVERFPAERQGDLWAGLGEACAFGGGRPGAPAVLRSAAGPFLPFLAQGIAFAAEARHRAGILTPHTELACQAVWECDAARAATYTREAMPIMPAETAGDDAALAAWRRALRERFTSARR
jgi:hypothetical protein